MAKLPPTYDVLALVSPHGEATKANVLTRKTYSTIIKNVPMHEYNWMVVRRTIENDIRVIDVFEPIMIDTFPYLEPCILNPTFKDVDHAIGFIVINLVS